VVKPEHEAHPNWIDIGDIPFGDVREKVVELANREGRPLTVKSIQAGCSCTQPTIEYTAADGSVVAGNARSRDAVITLPADAVARLKLRVDSHTAPAKNVDKVVVVRLVTDSVEEPFFTLDARMKIIAPFNAVPPVLDLGRVPQSGGAEGAIDIVPVLGDDQLLIDVAKSPKSTEVQLVPPFPGGGPAYKLRVKLLPPLALGNFEATVALHTREPNGNPGRPFEIPLRAYVVGDVEVLPARFSFAKAPQGGPERAEGDLFARLAGGQLRVTKYDFAGATTSNLRAELTPIEPDAEGRAAQWHIVIEATGDLGNETISGTLVLETDDPQFARIEIPWLRRGTAPAGGG
jgi:hypothetical protein